MLKLGSHLGELATLLHTGECCEPCEKEIDLVVCAYVPGVSLAQCQCVSARAPDDALCRCGETHPRYRVAFSLAERLGIVDWCAVGQACEYTESTLFGDTVSNKVPSFLSRKKTRSMGAVAQSPAWPRPVVSSLLHAVKNRFSLMGLPSFPAAHLIVLWGGVQLGMNGFAHRPSDYASHIRVPTLLVQGDRDARVTLAQSKHILTNLAGNKQWKIFRGEGHGYFAKKRPLEWKQAISSFLLRSIK